MLARRPRLVAPWIFLVVPVAYVGLAAWAAARADEPEIPQPIRARLQERNYGGAIAAIDEAVQQNTLPADRAGYLRGRALFLQGKFDAAIEAFTTVEQQQPPSTWAGPARFARGLALARKGDFRAAEEVYRREAVRLLSPERKAELAAIYLEFADRYFKPADEQDPPDYAKARQYYQQALELGPAAARRGEVELRIGRCAHRLGELAEASQLYATFIDKHAAEAATVALDIEARYYLGDVRMAESNLPEARRQWQDLLAKYAVQDHELLAQAAFRLAETYREAAANGSADALNSQVVALDAFLKRWPTHERAAEAHLLVALGLHSAGRHDDAVARLRSFLSDARFAGADARSRGQFLLAQSLRGMKKFPEAIAAWREFLTRYPAHELSTAAQTSIVDTEFLVAAEAYREENYDEARRLWTSFLAQYPLDARQAAILNLFGDMHYRSERYADAIADWRRVVSKFPNADPSSEAAYMIAVTLEDKLGKLDEALAEYRKVTWGSFAPRAKQRIAELTAKHLTVATDRVFRTNEPPAIHLTTRNVESVQVRVYVVDLETYFRKMHLGNGVDSLDIALIDPDHEFEFKIPDYQAHRRVEHDVEIQLPPRAPLAAGVLAVTVSSTTLETTTMMVRGDLDIVVKSSRDEVFVFAQNMRTGQPWPQARLLLSNGQQVFAEAQTGPDGVFRGSYKELRDAADVRVFAVADGNVASNSVDLNNLSVANGRDDRGYLYTDRPAYRPGNAVHVRGIVRRAKDDRYTIAKGAKYQLDVLDARSRVVHSETVALGEFGSFHVLFVLPGESAAGTYRVHVRQEDGPSFQGSFLVADYQLEPVRLEVDTPRKVYYRGEEIEGTIRAKFYYGAPLAGREIKYRLGNDREYTGTTNAQGEVAFKLPTRDFGESQVLPLTLVLAERNLSTAVNFVLATRGFRIEASTVRDVYLAGESFELTVRTTTADGQPIAQKLRLRVVNEWRGAGERSQRVVEEHDIATDERGVGRATLALKEGSYYLLRVEGTDQFGNPVEGVKNVEISDEDDSRRLRILADRHSYRVGDTAQVRVHWREAPALGLVTFQGARVLDYRLVPLKTGENEIGIPMDERLAPNFDLAVTVMTDARPDKRQPRRPVVRFHEANSPFDVERALRVELKVQRPGGAAGSVRPGDEVEVVVTAKDPQGKPVAAELSLGLIEQALLERFPTTVPAIAEFFRGARREPAVRTTSSVVFSYSPTTRPINPRLLAEKDRLEVEAEERARLELIAVSPRAPHGYTRSNAGLDAEREQVDRDLDAQTAAVPALRNLEELAAATDSPLAGEPRKAGAGAADGSGRYTDKLGWGARSDGSNQFGGLGGVHLERYSARQMGLSTAAIPFDDRGGDRYSRMEQLGETAEKGQSAQRPGVMPAEIFGYVAVIDGVQSNSLFYESLGEDARSKLGQAAVLLAVDHLQETGYWNPSIVTNDQGSATVKFRLPERSTAWKLQAKGISVDTLAGETEVDLVVKKDLFGELKLPWALTDGDRAQVLVTIHNEAVEKEPIEVTFTANIGGKPVVQKHTITPERKGQHELSFAIDANLPREAGGQAANTTNQAVFELEIRSGQLRDVVQQTIAIHPYGMPVFATAGGVATSDATIFVEAPKTMAFQGPKMQIRVGPTAEQTLLDVLSGHVTFCQARAIQVASPLDMATSDLLAALALQKLLAGTRDATGPQAAALDSRIRSALGQLHAAQAQDSGWSWSGRVAGKADPLTTARVFWAMNQARAVGYNVADQARAHALTTIRAAIAEADDGDHDTKAVLLHALSTADEDDFTLANRLYRERQSLSAGALAYLALAFAEMDRGPTASELLDLLAKKDLDTSPPTDRASLRGGAGSHSGAELRALQALALERVQPASPRIKPLVDWLLAHRAGNRWSPERATGPATTALAQWFGKTRFTGEHYTLTVFVHDRQVQVLEMDDTSGTQTIDVPATLLREGQQRVNFQITGRGRFTYQVELSGFVPADKLASTTKSLHVRRTVEPAVREFDGRSVPRGFGTVEGSVTEFHNLLTQLPVGQAGSVTLQVWRDGTSGSRDDGFEYLVVTEPLPCGAAVIESSIRGGFDRYELSPGAITFFLGSRRWIENIQFDLHGYLPGQYRAAPTIVQSAYALDRLAIATPKSLAVLPRDGVSADAYRYSPDELFHLGQQHFKKQSFAAAGKLLGELLAGWQIKAEPYQAAVRMLLDVHLELGPPQDVVKYFELVREKQPDAEIPFASILKIAAAYDAIGEYERSYLVYRAAVEASFTSDSGLAGFLEAQGEFLRSIDVMTRLLGEYPPEAYAAEARYALAQTVYGYAPQAAGDAQLREKKVTRVDLIRRAERMLDAFLAEFPDDPAADQASFSLANALLELKQYREAIGRCQRFVELYPKSDFVDSYWYVVGYCQFALGEHRAALETCQKVADMQRVEKPSGRLVESRNKWRAIYILAQIHHSLGEAAASIVEYQRVADRFPEARTAIDYFARKAISLPDVTIVRPGKPVEIELAYRNVARCDVRVYRIDLMKYSLLNKNLAGIAQINLAGIRPHHEVAVELGDGKDYGDRSRRLNVPAADEGAYLVVCRGGDLHASGLVLVTPLTVDVQEDATSGQIRATVRDTSNDKYIADVHVKVIGSRNVDFVAGETDLRGVFVAQGILGTSTTIARAGGDRYAFFRGQTDLGPRPEAKPAAPAEAAKEATDKKLADEAPAAQPVQQGSEALLDGLQLDNRELQRQQGENLKRTYQKQNKGVGAGGAF